MSEQWEPPDRTPDEATHDRGMRILIRAMHAAGTPLTTHQTEIAREMGLEPKETK
jgi:hypothetical protein